MMKIKRYNLLLVSVMLQLFVAAQTTGYQYQAKLARIDSSGFYNIVLTPAISSHLKTDHSDLRIVNDSGKWIPHVLWKPNEQYEDASMLDLKIIKKESSNAFTDLIVETMDSNISEFFLEIKNTLAERYCTLTASDDLSTWFIINDSIVIKPVKQATGNSDFTFEFPPVNYKYFRIYINNNGKAPFDIIKVTSPLSGQAVLRNFNKTYISDSENPIAAIIQKDSGNRSYIRITQSAAYHFDKISLKLSGAKYYNRNAEIYFPVSGVHSFANPGAFKGSIVLSNNSNLEFTLPVSNPTVFYIIIQNEDNPPIKVEHVKTLSVYRVASAWLEKNDHYKLIMDNAAAYQPNYDLQLKDMDMRKTYPTVVISNITQLPQVTVVAIPPRNNKVMIWIFIGIAVIVLAFFTWKLVSDMNKAKA